MPKLTAREKHQCFICQKIISNRTNLKHHLMRPTANGDVRCNGLKRVIPSDVWNNEIIPHYVADTKLPDLDEFRKKKMGRPVTPFSNVTTKRSRRGKSKVVVDENNFTEADIPMLVNIIRRLTTRPLTSPDEALAHYIVDLDMSQRKYKLQRKHLLKRSMGFMIPSYDEILLAKKRCYPGGLTVTKNASNVSLANLIRHFVSRLKTVTEISSLAGCTFKFKYGSDTMSDLPVYNNHALGADLLDGSMFIVLWIPLSIYQGNVRLWVNSHPTTCRLAVPLSIKVEKETPDSIRDGDSEFKSASIVLGEEEDEEKMELCGYGTMYDGMSLCALSHVTTHRCTVCERTPLRLNVHPDVVHAEFSRDNEQLIDRLKHSICPLHGGVKLMEFSVACAAKTMAGVEKWRV